MVSTYLHGDQKTIRLSIQYGIKSRSLYQFDGDRDLGCQALRPRGLALIMQQLKICSASRNQTVNPMIKFRNGERLVRPFYSRRLRQISDPQSNYKVPF